MGILDGLFGGGGGDPADLYGDLFSDKQRAALRDQQMTGLLGKLAGAFAQGGMPSRMPIPLGSTIGAAAAAGLGGQDEAMDRMLKGMQVAEQVRTAQQTRALLGKLSPVMQALVAAGIRPDSPEGRRAIAALGGTTAAATPAAAPAAPAPAAAPAAPIGGPPASPTPSLRDTPSSPMPPPNVLTPTATLPSGTVLPSPGASPGAGLPYLGAPGAEALPDLPNSRGAGLLGGPPDQVVGQSLPGQGVLAQIAKMQQGGDATGGLPFSLAAFRGGSAAPSSGDEVGSGDVAAPRTPGDPRGLIPYIRERAAAHGVDPDVAVKVAGSEGLGQFYGDHGKSGTAFQLYTGGGLGNEYQKETGRDPLDPKNEQHAIDWALANVQRTGWSPYHGAAKVGVGPRTGLPDGPSYVAQDEVIPSGRGVSASMLRNVADTGPAPAPAGAPTTPGGYIPGLGITPQGLAALNALTKMGGLGEPFGSLLETYYKSPQYLGEAAGATTRGQLGAEIELKPKLEAAIAWAKIAPNLDEYERKATVDRLTKQLEQLGAAATSSKEVVVSLPDGTRSKDTLTNEQILRLNAGKGVPERGIPPSARLSEPYLRPGQAEQETAAAAPQHLGPTDTVVYPPGSIGASTYQSDKMRGRALPDNVSIQPDGSVRVSGGSATVGQIDQTQQDFFKLKDTAATAREGLYKAQLLREQLHQIGTSGPITDTLGAFGALAQQLGVPEATVKQYLSVRPASVEAAEKLSQDLLGEVLKTTFPQRITNADIAAWKNTVPRGTMLQDAYDLLLDKTVMPKFQQAIGRYGSVAHLPATDPQLKTYTQELEKFDKANPLGSFVQPNSTDTGLPAGAVATGQYIRGKPVYRVPGDPKLKVLQ